MIVELRSVALDREHRARLALGIAAAAGDQGLRQIHPVPHFVPIDRQDFVADAQAGDRRRAGDRGAIRQVERPTDVADAGRGEFVALRLPGDPDDAGDREGEQDVERRARGKNDHLGGIVDRRQARHIGLARALDRAQVGQLRQEDVTAEGKPGQAVLHAVPAPVGPDCGPDPD